MKISCPQCHTTYHVPDEKIPNQGARTRCQKCRARIVIQPQSPLESSDSLPLNGTAPSADAPTSSFRPKASAPADETARIDDQLQRFVDQGDEDAAAQFLFDKIVAATEKRDFTTAETLRDKLYEVAPMALSEIVKAGEVIEEGKSQAMDSAHLSLWKVLYDRLTAEERNELYFAMRPLTVSPEQTVYQQGMFNSNLYFVQEGKLKLLVNNPKTQNAELIKHLTAGDVANITPFFSYSVCTASLVADTESRLTLLDKALLARWAETFPGIETPLYEYCQAQGTAGDMAKKSGLAIRAHRRVMTALPAGVQLLDDAGKPLQKPFRVSLADLSSGGLCCGMKLNRKAEAEQLLGQRLFVQLLIPAGENPKKVRQFAKIVAVHLKPFGGAAVHIQFDTPIDPRVVEQADQTG